MEQEDEIVNEIMALIDKRNRLCREWMEKINTYLREGSVSYEEYRMQSKMIDEELDKTKEVLERQKRRIEKSK